MGILKTHKNKSGLGVFITSHFMFKSDSRGHNIRNIPERFRFSLITLQSAIKKNQFRVFIELQIINEIKLIVITQSNGFLNRSILEQLRNHRWR